MKTVLIQGAFEILNAGHVQVFKQCKEQGDYLIVALNTNELLEEYKKRKAVLPWEEKKTIIEAIRWVDEVIPAPHFSPLQILKDRKVDVYCLSQEWVRSKSEEIAYMSASGGDIFITTDFPITRTSQIKKTLLDEAMSKDLT